MTRPQLLKGLDGVFEFKRAVKSRFDLAFMHPFSDTYQTIFLVPPQQDVELSPTTSQQPGSCYAVDIGQHRCCTHLHETLPRQEKVMALAVEVRRDTDVVDYMAEHLAFVLQGRRDVHSGVVEHFICPEILAKLHVFRRARCGNVATKQLGNLDGKYTAAPRASVDEDFVSRTHVGFKSLVRRLTGNSKGCCMIGIDPFWEKRSAAGGSDDILS